MTVPKPFMDLTDRPIGVFDSGVGGLSVYQHLRCVLPNHRFIYYADSQNVPYGDKSAKQIAHLTVLGVKWLIELGCKLVVVACNSASAYALTKLRTQFTVPIVGLVPAIKPACVATNTQKIALLATRATIDSRLLCDVIEKYATPVGIKVLTYFEPKLVPWVESGMPIDHNVADLLIKQMYTWLDMGVDTLVLGCTHYPFFKAFLQDEIDKNRLDIRLIDSGRAVALRAKSLINELNLDNHAKLSDVPLMFYSSAFDDWDFKEKTCDFRQNSICQISQNLIDTPICFIDKYGRALGDE